MQSVIKQMLNKVKRWIKTTKDVGVLKRAFSPKLLLNRFRRAQTVAFGQAQESCLAQSGKLSFWVNQPIAIDPFVIQVVSENSNPIWSELWSQVDFIGLPAQRQ